MQTFLSPSPLLAIDPGSVVAAIFFIVFIFARIAQFLGGGNKGNAPPRQRMGNPARPAQNQLQEGIELFKKMVAEQQKQNRQQQPPPRRPQNAPRQSSPPPIQPVRTAPQIRSGQDQRTQQQQKKKSGKQQPARKPTPETSGKSLGESVSRRHIPVEADLGRHVVAESQQALSRNSIAEQVNRDLQNEVSAEVAAHLGTRQTTPAQSASRCSQPRTAASIRTILNNRQNIAQAIIVSELLQPPIALRKK
ncbi:MAG: hypothetical protein KDA68_14945 [Planctomycetaceae bacterium]|nr:hypothetical protein [Planctomycetaceae bacterium]